MTLNNGGLNVTGPQLQLATVWQIRRKDGTVLAFTDHDEDITRDLGNGTGSQTHKASTGFARSALAAAAGLQVPNMETVGILDDVGIGAADLRAGLYRGAEVWVGQIDWTGAPGLLKMKRGWIADVSIADYSFTAQLVGLTSKLVHTEFGEHYTVECNADFKDARCGYAGAETSCDKQYETCLAYGNIVNFSGAGVLMPGSDVMLRYALKPATGEL